MPTNSSAIFSRLHTWGRTDTLLADDLNNEFNNILTNLNPSGIGGYSVNVLQMQVQTAPGTVGSESLATTVAGEFERIRFQLATIMGTTYWYQTPVSSIAQLNAAIGAASIANRVSSGVTTATGQPAFLIPDTTTNQVTLSTSTPFVYSIAGTQYTISSNITLGGLATAANTGAATTCFVADTNITSGQAWTQLLGENGSTINVATMGSTMTANIGKIVGLKNVTSGEFFLTRIASSTVLMDSYRGYFQNGATTFETRSNVTNGDTLFLMALSWIYATTAGALTAVGTNPSYSGTAPATPANGDRWFDLSANIWKTFDGVTWNDSHSTLIGISIQDNSKTVGTRAQDFFAVFNATNTIEIFDSSSDTAFPVRARYLQSTISVNGTLLNFGKSYLGWTATGSGLIDSTTLSTGVEYYFYVSQTGNFYVSSISPFDRQADLLGFYHPSAPYRCVGYAFCTTSGGSPIFGDIESFYRQDTSSTVSQLTAAVSNFPLAYAVQPTEQYIEINATGGVVYQALPPPIMWKGKRFTYMKTDSSSNAVTLQGWGSQVLVTTANITQGNTTIGSLASNTGLTAGITYFLSGPAIPYGATATWASSVTATSSVNSFFTVTGSAVTFATGTSINGCFTQILATQYESVTLFSDGSNVFIESRRIPSIWTYGGTIMVNSVAGGAAIGAASQNRVMWRRVGESIELKIELFQTGAGTAGTDSDYVFTLPNGFNMDTNKVFLTATDPLSSGASKCALGTAKINGANIIGVGMCIPYTATKFKVQYNVSTNPPAVETFRALGNINLSSADVSININAFFPILGWQG